MKPTLVFYAPKDSWRLVDAAGATVHECASFTEACALQRTYGVTPATGEPLEPAAAPKPSSKASSKKR